MKRKLLILSTVFIGAGCGGKNGGVNDPTDARTTRDTEIALEGCDVDSKEARKVDANGDGRAEIVRVMKGELELCRTSDLNFDGKVDRTSYFSPSGKLRRLEEDFDRDGIVDEIGIFKEGVILEKHRATTLDGKLDTWEFFENAQLTRTERDENGDGVIDQWWEYPSRGCPLIHVDTDGDGRPDPGASIDYCKETGFVPPPLPQEKAVEKLGFGKKDTHLEELSNTAQGAGNETGSGEAEPNDTKSHTDSTDESATSGVGGGEKP